MPYITQTLHVPTLGTDMECLGYICVASMMFYYSSFLFLDPGIAQSDPMDTDGLLL